MKQIDTAGVWAVTCIAGVAFLIYVLGMGGAIFTLTLDSISSALMVALASVVELIFYDGRAWAATPTPATDERGWYQSTSCSL